MRKPQHSVVVLFGLSVLSALVVCSTLPSTDPQANNKLELSFGQPNYHKINIKNNNIKINNKKNINKQNNKKKNNNTDIQIVGGLDATDGQFPHMVSLRRNNVHFCGGSIINQNWILTAAHCVPDSQVAGLTAVVGTNTLDAGGAAYQLVQITVHASFDPQRLSNDIAVVRVDSPIEFTSKVQSIRLTSDDTAPFTATTLSGWGLTSYQGSVANELQFIDLQTIDMDNCAEELGDTSRIGSGNLCTQSPRGIGACDGDSGGPLIQNYVQVGIVSWGLRCADGYPDVYTAVSFYHPWILSSIGGTV